MELTVYSSKSGFTLLEVLVAMVIMMIGLLALLQTVNVALLHNMADQLRNDAVQVADEQMVLEMTKPFDLISSAPPSSPNINIKSVSRNIYKASTTYTVTKTGSDITPTTKSVSLSVAWTYKGQNYNHSINSLISKYNN